MINLFLYIDIKKEKKTEKKEKIESFYSNFSCTVFNFGYLADQVNINRANKKKRYNNVYNTAMILLFIALADKKYIGDYKVIVSAIAKIHT